MIKTVRTNAHTNAHHTLMVRQLSQSYNDTPFVTNKSNNDVTISYSSAFVNSRFEIRTRIDCIVVSQLELVTKTLSRVYITLHSIAGIVTDEN